MSLPTAPGESPEQVMVDARKKWVINNIEGRSGHYKGPLEFLSQFYADSFQCEWEEVAELIKGMNGAELTIKEWREDVAITLNRQNPFVQRVLIERVELGFMTKLREQCQDCTGGPLVSEETGPPLEGDATVAETAQNVNVDWYDGPLSIDRVRACRVILEAGDIFEGSAADITRSLRMNRQAGGQLVKRMTDEGLLEVEKKSKTRISAIALRFDSPDVADLIRQYEQVFGLPNSALSPREPTAYRGTPEKPPMFEETASARGEVTVDHDQRESSSTQTQGTKISEPSPEATSKELSSEGDLTSDQSVGNSTLDAVGAVSRLITQYLETTARQAQATERQAEATERQAVALEKLVSTFEGLLGTSKPENGNGTVPSGLRFTLSLDNK